MPKSANTADEYDFVDDDETALSPEVVAQLRDWLQPTDYLADSGEFRRHLSSQAPGTGLWICKTGEYKRWHDSPDHGSLWIKGVPGAGKSVMAASLVQHLRTTEDCPVLFFFFRNIVAANFSPRALIQDWLAQILPYSPRLQFALQPRLQTSLAETSDGDLVQLFLDGVSCVPKLYCVGDALDEMTTENRSFLDRLNGLATYRPHSLKLLMTSRPKQYLQSALRDSSIVHISLQQRLVDADIVSYLNHRFDRAPKSDSQRHIKQQVMDMVARRSEGLFLYAKLTMDQVEAAFLSENPVDMAALEESLPVGLEQTYSSMLAKQRQEIGIDMDLQVLVLEAVTHASRPLRLNELAGFMKCVYPHVGAPAGFKALIASCCGPLLEILEDETLQVIHHSFTEFLRGDTRSMPKGDVSDDFPVIDSDKAHKRMAVDCLRYLQSGSLLLEGERSDRSGGDPSVTFRAPMHRIGLDYRGWGEQQDSFEYREARLLHPFLSYAVENWSYHASRYDVQDQELFNAVLDFMKPGSLTFRRWLVIRWGSTTKSRESAEGMPTALHIAAFAGLSELGLRLLEQGSSVSAVDAQERTPLHWAAANGHAKVASLLVQHGSDPNAVDGRGLKPIHLAARRNHASVVTLLLEAGVEPDTTKTKENHGGPLPGGATITKGECAILYASQGGHTETVIAMIPFCKPKTLEQLLCECCRPGRTDAVLAILDKSDVSANAMYCGATALYFACDSASEKCVEALISRGADVCKRSEYKPRRSRQGGSWQALPMQTPLHRLVHKWHGKTDSACRAIFPMLVEAGADLEQLDGRGNTALLIAAQASTQCLQFSLHAPALRALLEAGADVNKKDSSGNTALHLAVRYQSSLQVVRLLIEHGSDPNQRGSGGQTLLQSAMHQSRMPNTEESIETIVAYLLENGADPNCQDDHGHSVLFMGMSVGPEVFQLLLPRCNDDSVKRKCWFELSFEGSPERFAKYLKLFLAEGIDIDMRNEQGRTLYLCCLTSEDKLRALRSHGAKTDMVDDDGNNALHILCLGNRCYRELLEARIADGADPLSRNKKGDTLLHHVAAWYTTEPDMVKLVRWLIDIGISVNAANNEGRTALHVPQEWIPRGRMRHITNGTHFADAIKSNKEVDFEIRDNHGLTALHGAAMRSGLQVAALVAAGADLNALTEDSQNVLHISCRARQPDIVGQILGQPGLLDFNQKDRFGRTPFHYACSSGNAESVALLLRHGADVHAVDSDSLTPLHAAAEFTSEQTIWDALDRPYKSWLRGPPADPLRPVPVRQPRHHPWYQPEYGKPRPESATFIPAAGAIVKLLLDAGSDAAAVDRYNFTALDLALHTRCSEFVEIFAADEDLFARATKNLEEGEQTAERSGEIRLCMKAQMALMRPKSCLETLTKDQAAFEEVVKFPSRYLGHLTCEDAARLINEGFAANLQDNSYYRLVEQLMKPGNLQLVERVPRLVTHYGSYSSVRERMEEAVSECWAHPDSIIWTALQLVCIEPGFNMLMLQFLVEKLHVDVNAPSACLDRTLKDYKQVICPGGTALHVLASADSYWQLEGLRYLLANGADVNALDVMGQSPIHIAASGVRYQGETAHGFWRSSAVSILLDHGADPNLVDKRGLSPLHKASGAPDALRELLRRGADTTAGANNPLFEAIRDQNLSAMEILLDHGLSVNSVDEGRSIRDVHYSLTGHRKVYALLCSAFASSLNRRVQNSVPLLRALFERGADLYVQLNENETMLHFLFEYPEHAISDALLQEPCLSQVDLNSRDQRGRTVLMAACDFRGFLPGYQGMSWQPKTLSPPLRMLDYGADAALVDHEGKAALHHLLNNPGMPDEVIVQFINREEVALTLLLKDNDGFSPLHHALRILRPEICELLLSKGANLLESDPNGLTALHHIASQCLITGRSRFGEGYCDLDLPKDYLDRCVALWQRFIAEGGSINAADGAGNTPLHTYLLSKLKERSPGDSTPCHVAYYDRLFPSDSGVDILAVNAEGETALHVIARRTGQEKYSAVPEHDRELFEAMMGKGADPLAEDAMGRSALDVASAYGKDDIVGVLRRKS
ncbi:hypothetical protein ACHAPT_010922 [Fusarium lateritium]